MCAPGRPCVDSHDEAPAAPQPQPVTPHLMGAGHRDPRALCLTDTAGSQGDKAHAVSPGDSAGGGWETTSMAPDGPDGPASSSSASVTSLSSLGQKLGPQGWRRKSSFSSVCGGFGPLPTSSKARGRGHGAPIPGGGRRQSSESLAVSLCPFTLYPRPLGRCHTIRGRVRQSLPLIWHHIWPPPKLNLHQASGTFRHRL